MLEQLPSRFAGSFSRSYRDGHINTIDLISTIELLFVIHFNSFLLFFDFAAVTATYLLN